MNLPKANRILCRNSRDKPNWDQYEGQSEITRPQGRRSHKRQLELITRVRIWLRGRLTQGEQKQFDKRLLVEGGPN